MKAEFNTNKGRKKGELIKANVKTVWVKFKYKFHINWDKPKDEPLFEMRTKTIKRHKMKHNVVIVGG
jgi:5-methylthioribose kinase